MNTIRTARWNMHRWLAALAFAAMTSACSTADGDQTDGAALSQEDAGARIVNVEVTPVALTEFSDFIRVTGEVAALYDVTVSAEESGAIARFYVEKGARVERNQPMAKIDDVVLTAQVSEARALAELAGEQWARQRRLWEEDQIGSEISYLQAKSSADAARARLETLEARLRRTVITAPVTGLFDDKFVELGEMVGPGSPVVRVVSVGRVKIVAGVPERFAATVQAGDSARVTLDVLPGREFMGRIGFVGASVDARSRTIPIEIVMDNPGRIAKPRMVANVLVQRERLRDVVVVPQDVVVRTEDGYQVYVITQREGRPVAEARLVTLGAGYANRVVVTDGLAVGESLITLGHRLVEHGSRVRIVNAEKAGR